MKELKDCPFCGGEPELYAYGVTTDIGVRCKTDGCCDISGMFTKGNDEYATCRTKKQAIEKWNTRPDKLEELEELKVAIIIQREVKRADVLPKHSVDVLDLKTCERIAKSICARFGTKKVRMPEKIEHITTCLFQTHGICNCHAGKYNKAIDDFIKLNPHLEKTK